MTRPLPLPDADSQPYWDAAREHRLLVQRCQGCGTLRFPPRPICSRCLSGLTEWVAVSGHGQVYSYCVMHEDLVSGLEPPYVVVQVELAEQAGLRLIANLLDCPAGSVRIGLPVEVTFERVTDEVTLPQFRPRQTRV